MYFDEHLAMLSLSRNWRGRLSRNQWNLSIGHSLDHWECLDFLLPHRDNDNGSSQRAWRCSWQNRWAIFKEEWRMDFLCLALMNLLHSVALPSSILVTMPILIPHGVVNSDRLSPEEDRLREDYYHEALAFCRHTINLEFDEETIEPEKATPRNEGIDPSTIKMKQWHQGHDRVSDKKAPTGTDRTSYHARETNWGWWTACDETRWYSSTSTWTSCQSDNSRRPISTGVPAELENRCTVPPATKTPTLKHGLTIAEVSSHNPWGQEAQTLISTTYQRTSAASSSTTWVHIQQKDWISETWEYW